MKIDTKLSHIGRSTAQSMQSVSPPLVRTSTVVFPNLKVFKDSYSETVFESPRYGRSGTQTSFELQSAMAELEEAETCIATSCGLSAITAVLSSNSKSGAHVLINSGVYGPTEKFCTTELKKNGVECEFFDHNASVKSLIRPNTSIIFIEVPASITMELFDIREICEEAHKHNVPVACDSSWGTPIFFKPHSLGVDISIHAATKYINGHSDAMLGLITGSYKSLEPIREWCNNYGSHVSPDSCWLALRGLRTLSIRMQHHQRSTLKIVKKLQTLPQMLKIFYPPLSSGKQLELWETQFTGSAGPFTVELCSCSEIEFTEFIDSLKLFSLGTSWGGFESLVMPAIPHHLRNKAVMPDEGRLVRFHIGLEDPEDLFEDIHNALTQSGILS